MLWTEQGQTVHVNVMVKHFSTLDISMVKAPRQSHKNICLQEKAMLQNWSAQVSCSWQVICKSAYGCVGVIAHYGNVFLNMEYAIPKYMN